MREQIAESIQAAAAGKGALLVGAGIVTAPSWISWADSAANSPLFVLATLVLGAVVSISIIVINVQAFIHRAARAKQIARQERIRTALLEVQAARRKIDVT